MMYEDVRVPSQLSGLTGSEDWSYRNDPTIKQVFTSRIDNTFRGEV